VKRMKIILTGAYGFAGSTIAAERLAWRNSIDIIGVDNLSRAGSELNRPFLTKMALGCVISTSAARATLIASLPPIG
jgi:nucleoside-diphosphate-sugar epimerase